MTNDNLDKKAKSIAENIRDVAKNTSGGGQVGGTYYGQEPDATTVSSADNKAGKPKDDGNKT